MNCLTDIIELPDPFPGIEAVFQATVVIAAIVRARDGRSRATVRECREAAARRATSGCWRLRRSGGRSHLRPDRRLREIHRHRLGGRATRHRVRPGSRLLKDPDYGWLSRPSTAVCCAGLSRNCAQAGHARFRATSIALATLDDPGAALCLAHRTWRSRALRR